MVALVKHSELKGTLSVPGSKSYMQRACTLALLRSGKTIITNPSFSSDDKAVLQIIQQLGAKVEDENAEVHITGNPSFNFSGKLDCNESGLALRMLVPLVGTSAGAVSFTGKGSLMRRPVDFFDRVLPSLNVQFTSSDGFLPVFVKGPLIPASVEVDGSLSSQFVTGMLFAYCHVAHPGTVVRVTGVVSKPYLDISVEMLGRFGYEVLQLSDGKFVIGGKKEIPGLLTINIPGDWSNAAFHLVAGAIAGDLSIQGLDMQSLQGDRAIIDVLKSAGADIIIDDTEIRIKKRTTLSSFNFDATDSPDLFPPLIALAVFCNGTSQIMGVSRLVHKESNRAKALVDVFTAMGAEVWITGEVMKVKGGKELHGAGVHSYNDHRIVMAAAVAALASHSEIMILDAEAVSKSYPSFFDDLSSIGAQVYLT